MSYYGDRYTYVMSPDATINGAKVSELLATIERLSQLEEEVRVLKAEAKMYRSTLEYYHGLLIAQDPFLANAQKQKDNKK